jgi:hypothetical protein
MRGLVVAREGDLSPQIQHLSPYAQATLSRNAFRPYAGLVGTFEQISGTKRPSLLPRVSEAAIVDTGISRALPIA